MIRYADFDKLSFSRFSVKNFTTSSHFLTNLLRSVLRMIVSSAWIKVCMSIRTSSTLHFWCKCSNRSSMKQLKRSTDDAAPCLTPRSILKLFESSPWNLMMQIEKLYNCFNAKSIHLPMPSFTSFFSSNERGTLSNAFSMSTDAMYRVMFCFFAISIRIRSVKMWINVDFSFWNAVWSMWNENHDFRRLVMTLSYRHARIFIIWIPLKFFGSLKFPFFGIRESREIASEIGYLT